MIKAGGGLNLKQNKAENPKASSKPGLVKLRKNLTNIGCNKPNTNLHKEELRAVGQRGATTQAPMSKDQNQSQQSTKPENEGKKAVMIAKGDPKPGISRVNKTIVGGPPRSTKEMLKGKDRRPANVTNPKERPKPEQKQLPHMSKSNLSTAKERADKAKKTKDKIKQGNMELKAKLKAAKSKIDNKR